jgi:hypothetical protein
MAEESDGRPGTAPNVPAFRTAEPQWPTSVALFVGALLNLIVPQEIAIGNLRWFLPVFEGIAAIAVSVGLGDRLEGAHTRAAVQWRRMSVLAIAVLTAANIISLVLLVRFLLQGNDVDGSALVRSAISIWSTNVIAYAAWYWELDGGGPVNRRDETSPVRDFVFPQMTEDNARYAPSDWYPRFLDYLYVSFTNATAFSPTDTMPLSGRAKSLMAVQATVALVTIGIVAARAVNILK